MIFQSTAQAGQDLFCFEVHGRKTHGSFLDIGCHHATMSNNSYSLERIGWDGIISDIAAHPESIAQRRATFIEGDATRLDWGRILGTPSHWDFLSLDVDGASLDTLRAMPLSTVTFGVICGEHDQYQHGVERRDKMREILRNAGYVLVCGDVMVEFPAGNPVKFEDWHVAPDLYPEAQRFECDGVMWSEILKDVL